MFRWCTLVFRDSRQGGGERVLIVLLKSFMKYGFIVWTGFI